MTSLYCKEYLKIKYFYDVATLKQHTVLKTIRVLQWFWVHSASLFFLFHRVFFITVTYSRLLCSQKYHLDYAD